MSISIPKNECPSGFRQTGFTYVPMNLLFNRPYAQFKLITFLFQRANWSRKSTDFGRYYFDLKTVDFISERYLYTCLKSLHKDGVICQFTRKGAYYSGRISSKALGPQKGSIPITNLYLTESINSESTFIFSKLCIMKARYSDWTMTRIRTYLATHYTGINPNFFKDYETKCPLFSAPFPEKYMGTSIIEKRDAVLKKTQIGEGSTQPVLASLPQVLESIKPVTSVPDSCTPVQIQKPRHYIDHIKKDYETLNIAICETQKRQTYELPGLMLKTLMSLYASQSCKFKLNTVELNFVFSIVQSLMTSKFRGSNPEDVLKTAMASFWFCTQKNKFIQTKSCIWSRVYAYASHNHSEWIWREFQSMAKASPSEMPKPTRIIKTDDGAAVEVRRVGEPPQDESSPSQKKMELFHTYLDNLHPGWRSGSALQHYQFNQKHYHNWSLSQENAPS